jgi:hypothetical protein
MNRRARNASRQARLPKTEAEDRPPLMQEKLRDRLTVVQPTPTGQIIVGSHVPLVASVGLEPTHPFRNNGF